MSTESMIADSGDLRKYRTELPNLIDDMDLSVYAFRLYVHLKRVAGQNGQCWQSTRTLATHCKMSVSKVSQSKQELIDAGLIMVDAGDRTQGQSDTITICDIWGQNFVRYSSDQPVRDANTPVRVVTGGVRVVTGGVRVVEHKKEPYKKEPYKKEPKEGESNSTRQLAHETVQAQPAPAPPPKRRGRVTKDFIDPRKLIAGMIPAGQGTTPVEIHREFFDWSNPAEGLSRFNSQVVTDEIKDLDRWRATCRAWAEKGYRGGNREGLQEWYRGGNQPAGKDKPNATSRAKVPTDGWHAGLVKEWQPSPEDDADFQQWLDSLSDQPEQSAVRPLRQRANQSAAD